MSEIFFIRHAETDMAGTFCGHSDPNLNPRGRAQLAALVAAMRSEDIATVYTSDLRRAQATARSIAEALELPFHLRPALREIDFGQWEGLAWNEIEQRDEAYAKRWLADYPNLPAPDGEDIGSFQMRVLDEVEFLASRVGQGNFAVVTHGGVLRTILCNLHGHTEEAAWEQTKSYCCIIRYPLPRVPPPQRTATSITTNDTTNNTINDKETTP